MILLTVLIILFIILLLYKCRLFTEEKYTIGSLGIDWKNYANVSGTVNKWIMVLYDDETGNKIHETEDDSPQNLQNFMDVNLKAIENKKFGSEILGTNTLSVYYNSISDDTKVYSGEFSLGTNDFSASVSDISAKESNVPTWYELTSGPKKDTLEEILGTEGTKIYVYPKDSTEDLYKSINRNACDINDPKWWVRKTCFILELGFEETGDIGYFYPYFPGLVNKYFGVNSTNKIVLVNETSRKKFYLEKPEGVTDTDTVKYGKFAYETTGGDKYYMYVSGDDKLKVAKLSDINNKSSTIFEFRYSKDCESYWTNLMETDDGKIAGYNVFDCGPNDIHDCQYWGHIRRDASGKGEACPSDMKGNNYLIKTQWPKKSTINEMNTNFPEYLETEYPDIIAENTDPNKNQMLAITPQYYKNEYDTLNAIINANKAPPAAPGQQVFTSSGTFTVPTGVTSLSCVVVGGGGGSTGCSGASQYSGAGGGGGGLAYGTFPVTSGSTVTVQVGAGGTAGTNKNLITNKAGTGGESKITYGGTIMLRGYGGSGGAYGTTVGANGGGFSIAGSGVTLSGGGYGGNGGRGLKNNGGGGGGGAGGYGVKNAPGGKGGVGNSGTGSYGNNGGGGGGGGQSIGGEQNNGGGGVGLEGQGSDGFGGSKNKPGAGGSGGASGGKAGVGGTYGGGAGGPEDDTNRSGSVGGAGGVRIIWGSGRSYPSTNTADESVAVDACVPNQTFLNNPYISPASVNIATNKCDQSTDCGKGTSTILDETNRTNQEAHIINTYLDTYYSGTSSLDDLPSYLSGPIVTGIQPWVNVILEKTYEDVCTYKTK